MRILVGWDEGDEVDLLQMYLGIEGNEAVIETDPDTFVSRADKESWDVVLIATSWPDVESSFEIFQKLQLTVHERPVVAATHPADVYRLARFLTAGLRSYVIRDGNKDYMFLLQASLAAAIDAVRAERERLIAEKLRQEVDSVRKLQESIIPRMLHMPEGYDIKGRYEPSEIRVLGGQPVTMAGGDYYNALTLPDGNVALIVGDASGHGMKACMSIMTLHTLIQMFPTQDYRDTAGFIEQINRNISRQSIVSDDGSFITLLYGILNPKEQTFEWTAAGHPLPLLQRLTDQSITEEGDADKIGMPIGVWEEAEFEAQQISIPDNSRLFLYTDGLVEAYHDEDGKHTEFGLQGIRDVMTEKASAGLEELIEELFSRSHDFTEGVGRHDDTSVLIVHHD